MWIGEKLAAGRKKTSAASEGLVTGVQEDRLILETAAERRDVKMVAPYGVAGVPPEGSSTVSVEIGAGTACLGVLSGTDGLLPGELLLKSSGGAKIKLTSDGKIELLGELWVNGTKH